MGCLVSKRCLVSKPTTKDGGAYSQRAGGAPQQTGGKPLPPNTKAIKSGASDWKTLTANVLDRKHENVREFVS